MLNTYISEKFLLVTLYEETIISFTLTKNSHEHFDINQNYKIIRVLISCMKTKI